MNAATRPHADGLVESLRAIVGDDNVIADPAELIVYECDGLTQHKHRPRAVVFPTTTEMTAVVVQELARAGVTFAPRGAGTGLSGGALALNQGVIIELARMRRVLKVDHENRLAVVQTGLVNAQLSRAVAPYGLYYVPDPSSNPTCTIGGNIAENAGGIHCLKYGTTTDHVVGARVVLSDGEIHDLGGAGTEATGYDLLGVFVGAEGTFGIATEATVRLTPLPAAVETLLADFTDVNDASRAVSALIAAGLMPAALEMLDGATIRAVEASVFAAGLPPDADAALLIELDGLAAGLADEARQAEAICRQHGARNVRRAADEHERKKLWAARKGAFGAMGRLAPDLMLQDAVVPRSRLPEVLAEIYRIGAHYRLRLANVFHAGDGNLHPLICFDLRDKEEVRRVEAASREIVETCVRAGGTITGEHGVGLDKRAYLPLIFSEDDLAAMLQVRAAFDPSGLCNPGKIIPAPRGCGEARAIATAEMLTARHTSNAESSAESTAASLISERVRAQAQTQSLHSPFTLDEVRRQCAALVGDAHVDCTAKTVTAAPASVEEARELILLAGRNGWAVAPAGACTWLDAGNTLSRSHLVVTTRRMARLVKHEPADLVATAEAGLTFAQFDEATRRAGQWLPLDPPDDGRATVGGIVATGLAGAQAFGYGLPRGFVIGMRALLADGRHIKAGGNVVKNVAGYDLCKLFTGSYGTLGLITELTFKLRPRPAREATVVVQADDADKLCTCTRNLLAGNFLPAAAELLSPALASAVGAVKAGERPALLLRFAGMAAAVEDQLARACAFFPNAAQIDLIEPDAHLWQALAARPLDVNNKLIWRASCRPTELLSFIAAALHDQSADDVSHAWQAGVGDGRVRFFMYETAPDAQRTAFLLKHLRSAAQLRGGSLVVERASAEVKRLCDATGVRPATARLMRRVKQQLDPADIFSPGRFGSEQ